MGAARLPRLLFWRSESDHEQGVTTVAAGKGRPLYRFRDDSVPDPQHFLNEQQHLSGIAVQKAVIPHPPESPGKHVLHQQPQEILAWQRSSALIAGLAVPVMEGDLFAVLGDNLSLANNPPDTNTVTGISVPVTPGPHGYRGQSRLKARRWAMRGQPPG